MNTSLLSLDLHSILNGGSNEIGEEGAAAIAEAMKTNTTLTCLNLHSDDHAAVFFILTRHIDKQIAHIVRRRHLKMFSKKTKL